MIQTLLLKEKKKPQPCNRVSFRLWLRDFPLTYCSFFHSHKNAQSTTCCLFHTEMASPTASEQKSKPWLAQKTLTHTHGEQRQLWAQTEGLPRKRRKGTSVILCWADFHLDWNREAWKKERKKKPPVGGDRWWFLTAALLCAGRPLTDRRTVILSPRVIRLLAKLG